MGRCVGVARWCGSWSARPFAASRGLVLGVVCGCCFPRRGVACHLRGVLLGTRGRGPRGGCSCAPSLTQPSHHAWHAPLGLVVRVSTRTVPIEIESREHSSRWGPRATVSGSWRLGVLQEYRFLAQDAWTEAKLPQNYLLSCGPMDNDGGVVAFHSSGGWCRWPVGRWVRGCGVCGVRGVAQMPPFVFRPREGLPGTIHRFRHRQGCHQGRLAHRLLRPRLRRVPPPARLPCLHLTP